LRGRGCALPLKSGSGAVGFHSATMGAAAAAGAGGKGRIEGKGGGGALRSPAKGAKAQSARGAPSHSSPGKKPQQHGLLELEAKWGDSLPGLSGGYA